MSSLLYFAGELMNNFMNNHFSHLIDGSHQIIQVMVFYLITYIQHGVINKI